MPGGRSDEVLDLGLIPATAAKKPEPAAPGTDSVTARNCLRIEKRI